jgi:hypothetical protein
LGFIFCYIAAQVYHYFEYFDDPIPGLVVIIFLIINFYLIIKLNKSIKKIEPKKVKETIKDIHKVFVFLLFFLMTELIIELPYIANHSNFNLFFITILLTIYAIEYTSNKKLRLNLIRNNKFLIYSLITVYFSAAIHKINYDFFNSIKSCANWYHVKLFKRFIDTASINQIPNIILQISPYVVTFLETIAPLLLLFNRFRTVGIYFLIFLHSYLALGGFSDFSALAMSIIFLYIPESLWDTKKWFIKTQKYLFLSIAIITLCWIGFYIMPEFKKRLQTAQGIVLIYFMFYFLRSNFNNISYKIRHDYRFLAIDSFIYFQIVILMIFGLAPYLGLRSGGNFTMFSNIRIIGDQNNHLFIKKLNIFGLEDEIYQIIKTNHEDIFLENRDSRDWITKSGLRLANKRAQERNYTSTLHITLKDIDGNRIKLNSENINLFLGDKKNILFYKLYMYSYMADISRAAACRW